MMPYPFKDRYAERQAEAGARAWRSGELERLRRRDEEYRSQRVEGLVDRGWRKWKGLARELLLDLAGQVSAEGRMGGKRFLLEEGHYVGHRQLVVSTSGIHRIRWWGRTKGNDGDHRWKYWYSFFISHHWGPLDFAVICAGDKLDRTRLLPAFPITEEVIRQDWMFRHDGQKELPIFPVTEEAIRQVLMVEAYKRGPVVSREPLYPDLK